MEINNTIFEIVLKKNKITKKDFSKYSEIPYNTVVGWRKKNHVPRYAMIILKDMNYRRKLDLEITQSSKKNILISSKKTYSLTENEKMRIEGAFWGTNYTIDKIAEEVKEKNPKIIKRLKGNLPFKIYSKILGKFDNA